MLLWPTLAPQTADAITTSPRISDRCSSARRTGKPVADRHYRSGDSLGYLARIRSCATRVWGVSRHCAAAKTRWSEHGSQFIPTEASYSADCALTISTLQRMVSSRSQLLMSAQCCRVRPGGFTWG